MSLPPFTAAGGSVGHHLGVLAAKVDELAERAGLPSSTRPDLRASLAALPWRERRRLGLLLEGVRVQAGSEELATAVDLMLSLAGEIWSSTPPPEESKRDEPH
jgi:hypothetical protein